MQKIFQRPTAIGAATLYNPTHESIPLEGRKISGLLAGSDKPRGDTKFVLDGNRHPAFSAAVQLGEDQSGQADGLMKFLRLHQRI